jgi:transcriptional regulator
LSIDSPTAAGKSTEDFYSVANRRRTSEVEKHAGSQYDTETLYLPTHFNETRNEVLHALMREHPLATLVAVNDSGLVANHLPMRIGAEPAPGILRGHVARANPLWKDYRSDIEALAIFQGPHTYISPSLYPSKQATGEVVPTWNYAVVHARGTLRFIHDRDWLRDFVSSLTDEHEAKRSQPWKVTDAPASYVDQMLALIVGFELSISSLTGKWKLGQNRSKTDREGLIVGLAQSEDANSRQLSDMLATRET